MDKLRNFKTTNFASDVASHDLTLLVKDDTNVHNKFMLIANLPNFNFVAGVSIAKVVFLDDYGPGVIVFEITLAKVGATTTIHDTKIVVVDFLVA